MRVMGREAPPSVRSGLGLLSALVVVVLGAPSAFAQCPGTDTSAPLSAFPSIGGGAASVTFTGDFTGSTDGFDEAAAGCWGGAAGLPEEVYSFVLSAQPGLNVRFDTRGSAVDTNLLVLQACTDAAACQFNADIDPATAASQTGCLFVDEGAQWNVVVTPADGGQLGAFQLRVATCDPAAVGCGDGVLDAGEACDDGNDVDDDDCNNACEVPVLCGNGAPDPGEQCDDGNRDPGDGCDADCQVEVPPNCGDGVEDADEPCDDGNGVDDDACDNFCRINPARLGCGATTLVDGFGGPAGYGANSLPAGDDGSSDRIDLAAAFPDGLDFYGTVFTSFYVNINGNVTFDQPNGSYTPDPFPISDQPMIAPFWGDVDTRGAGAIYWHVDDVGGRVIVTWDAVGYFSGNTEPTNTFQLILTDRSDVAPGAFDVEFRYGCLGWLTGDASGGQGGQRGTEAQAGFDAGNGQDFVTLPGSRTSGVLDIRDRSNVNDPGVWRWSIRAGAVIPASCGDGNDDPGEECDDGGNTNGDGCDAECFREVCGNDRLQAGEGCDDGNVDDGDGCDAECVLEECGNGKVQAGEQCEDGNNDDGDGCSATCQVEIPPSCGDGTVDAGEACDAVALPTATCDIDCTLAACGDGVLNAVAGEQCEDGNNDDGDGCSGNCQLEVPPACGDGNVDAGEACDDVALPTATCDFDCTLAACGDGVLNPAAGEQCEDGNNDDGDGCSATCQLEVPPDCGDGTVDAGEACDDVALPTATCDIDCTLAACGDGVLNAVAGEQCEDGNAADGDGCSSTCQLEAPPRCGDGNQDAGEACDDGNNDDGDGCDAFCRVEPILACDLNGMIEPGEGCDDGNTVAGDGCGTDCQAEAGFRCVIVWTSATVAVSQCDPIACELPVCGDGVVQTGEACDATALPSADCDIDCTAPECGDGLLNTAAGEACEDGNTTAGDGCDASCKIETTPTPTNVCGDGIVDPAREACDDAALPTADCDGDCTLVACGDGVLNTLAGEECEDGNAVDGDGCSATCQNEVKPRPIQTDAVGGADGGTSAPPRVEITGGACAAAPVDGAASFPTALVLFVFAGALVLRLRRRAVRAAVGLAVAASLFLGAGPLSAQTLDVQRFRPSPFKGDLFAVGKADTESPLAWSLGLFGNYQNDPLVVRITGGSRNTIIQKVVEHQLTFDFLGAAYVTDWFAIGFDLPIVGWQDGQDLSGFPTTKSSGLGDLRILPKFRLVKTDGGLFSLAFLAGVQLPSSQGRYMGRSEFTFLPGIQATLDFGVAGVSLDVAATVALGKDDVSVSVVGPGGATTLTDIGSQQYGLQAGLGAWYAVWKDHVDLIAEVYYMADFDDIGAQANNAIEVGGGVEWHATKWLDVAVGGGAGLTRGVAAPEWRVYSGLIFSYEKEIPAPPAPADTDGDGLIDPEDECPLDPEDRDGVQDEDGCPDADNDADGICDPWVALEGKQGKYETLCKGSDLCPNVPEDMDGFEDEDGCPDPDNDQDKICDPWVAQNGELDRYSNVCKGSDNCPEAAEVYNEVDDEDGCPDRRVKLETKKIVILQTVLFYFDKTIIKPESYPLLDDVVQTLVENPWILKVRVEGHTDERGKQSYNQKLSEGRAKAVYEYLVSHGVAAERLTFKGFGFKQPLVKGATTEEDHQRNRRVEFIILEQVPPEGTVVE